MTEPYTAKITIDIKAVSAEHANELWLAAVQLIETTTASGSSYLPGKGEVSFSVVETGNPDAGSLQREMNELMAKALRGELD
jgi:hypothetical protein